jgi:hypothetical protein
MNRPGHGLSVDEIAHSLAEMVRAGELTVSGRHELKSDRAVRDERRVYELISKPIHEYQPCWYRLTRRGGASWEQWARPDWSRYNTSSGHIRGIALKAATKANVEELFELERHLHRHREILLETHVTKVLRPWRATYWKCLPEGHLIAFAFTPAPCPGLYPTPQWAWARWCALNRWYEPPSF